MFKTILVGTDGSEPAIRALKTACELSKLCKGEITLVHTPRPDTVAYATQAMAGYHGVAVMPDEDEVKAAAEKILTEARAAAKAEGCDIKDSVVKRGDPGDEILEMAKEIEADLIITGRRGLGNIAGLVIGSTSQRISHLATCAVMTVP